MRICTLASGSGGNSVFVESGSTRILIDAGLSCKALSERMRIAGIDPTTLTAAIFTHEHTDHVGGAGVLGRRYKIPLYFNQGTRRATRGLGKCNVREFETGQKFAIDDLEIHPFSISHDSVDPVGYAIQNGSARLGYAADLGVATRLVTECLKDADVLLLESNHDPYLLEVGPYPYVIKQRVASKTGHLSNGSCGDLLTELIHEKLRHVVLVHLSESNNTPELAYEMAQNTLEKAGADEVGLQAASQGVPCEMIEI